MKKSLLLIVALVAVFSAMAQHEHLYIYRNDNSFNYLEAAAIHSVNHPDNSRLQVAISDGDLLVDLEKIDSMVVRPTAIPDIYVALMEHPELEDLIKGNGYTKETIYPADIELKGNGMYEDMSITGAEFRGRGNSTWNFAKTPYRFKMSKKAAVCGMKKAKTFALIANMIDPSMMHNAIAFWLARRLGLPYTNSSIPVNVYINGHYRGAYIITEKIGIGSGSVDIDEATGMLFEIDSNYDEDYKFEAYLSGYDNKLLPVMVKDPDLTEIKPDASEREAYWQSWQRDFQTMLDAVTGPKSAKLSTYVDLQDAARFILVNSIACNRELNHPKSFYLYKSSIDDVYHFGPVWDFDWSCGYDGVAWADHHWPLFNRDGDNAGATFFQHVCQNEEFMAVYKTVWQDFYENIYPEMMEYLDRYAALIEPSAKLNGLKWPDQNAAAYAMAPSSFDAKAKVDDLRNWIQARVDYCNRHSHLGLY